MKAGGSDASILSVKTFDPVVKFFEVGKVIDIVGGGRAITLKPDKLGGGG